MKTFPPALLPDYSKSFGKVYWEYTIHILQATDDVRLIERGGEPISEVGVPTWVPDFRLERDPAAYVMPQGGSDTSEHALEIPNNPLPQEPINISSDQRTLSVFGFKLGIICSVSSQPADLGEPIIVRELRAFFSRMCQLVDVDRSPPKRPVEQSVAEWVHPWLRHQVWIKDISEAINLLVFSDYDGSNDEDLSMNAVLTMIWNNCWDLMSKRDYFTTDTHISGFTTRMGAKALEGDLVVLLEGASTFYLLRHAEENEVYQFIGTVRLHENIMKSILASDSTPGLELNLNPVRFSLVWVR